MLKQNERENREALHRLETRVVELETENCWLRTLIMDKSEATERTEDKAIADERKGCEHKDRVPQANGGDDVCLEARIPRRRNDDSSD